MKRDFNLKALLKRALDKYGYIWDMRRKRKICTRADKFRDFYQDELSLRILDDREEFLLNSNMAVFADRFIKEGLKVRIPSLEGINNILLVYDDDRSDYYKLISKQLTAAGRNDYKKIPIGEYLKGNADGDIEMVVPVFSEENHRAFCKEIEEKYPDIRIYHYKYGRENGLIGSVGKQYLDVYDPVEDEIVIDAGSYDGKTALRFIDWGGTNIKKIYAFEADPEN